jgi:hypothetical protein
MRGDGGARARRIVKHAGDGSQNYVAPVEVLGALVEVRQTEEDGSDSWLGMTQTTGLNGEQLQITYDSAGRPSRAMSPYGATTTYSYTQGTLPMQQTKTGPDGFTRTTLDGVGRAIRVERGTDVSHIQSIVDTVYAPCACSPLGKVQQVSQP